MKKIVLLGCIAVLSVAGFAGCGKKETVSNSTSDGNSVSSGAVLTDSSELTYDMLYEANNGYKLLEQYKSVEYQLTTYLGVAESEENVIQSVETWDLFKNGEEYIISMSSDLGKYEVFMNGTSYYKDESSNIDNPIYHKGWFMEGAYDEYMKESISGFLVSQASEEDFDKITEKEDTYEILSYVGENEGERYYYRYSVDKKTLQIQSYEAVIMKTVDLKTEEIVVAKGMVIYDKEVEMPKFMDEIDKAKTNKRTVTIHKIDKAGEKDIVVELPDNTTLAVGLLDGYGLYLDEKGTVEFDDTNTELNEVRVYPDTVCYLMPEK